MNIKQQSIERPYISLSNRGRKYVKFGQNNLFPDELLSLIERSPIQNVIINKKIEYTYGLGLSDYSGYEANNLYSWDDLIKLLITDYIIFGAYSIQIIKVKDRFMFFHQPVNEVRMSPFDDNNKSQMYYISNNWSNINNYISIPAWGSETIEDGKPYLMYYKQYKPGEYYYTVPDWYSAANWISADAAISRYYNNYISNNFSANIAINYPYEPTEDKKEEIYNNLVESFAGENNAGAVLLLFGENGVKPEITQMSASNADLYNSVEDIVKRNILTANNVSSPTLFGITTATGFSSTADEMITGYTLFKNTVILPIRNNIIRTVNYLRLLNKDDELNILDIDIVKELSENKDNSNNIKIDEANSVQ